jgi:uncharacterized protein
MKFFTSEILTKNLSFTPEGFLLCANVPIARIGEQTYYAGEVPVTPDQNGSIIVMRDPDEVFHPEAVASFEGKPITLIHPEEEVTPETWRKVAMGHSQNIRRGGGLESDTLMADILIMDPDAIKVVVNRELREVSCGYDCDYIETAPGRAKQTNIRGNHVALVPKGRCGGVCAIHDSKPEEGGGLMTMDWFKKLFPSLTKDQQTEIKQFVKDADPEEEEKEKEMSKSFDSRLAKVEDGIATLLKMAKDAAEEEEEEKKKAADKRGKDALEEEEEEKEKTQDRAYMKDSAPSILQDILYRASILAPELPRMTQDSALAMSRKTFDEQCCLTKRKTLDAAYRTEAGRGSIAPFLGSKSADFFTTDCATVDLCFIGASEVAKKSSTQDASFKLPAQSAGVTPADINKINASFWQNRGGK